MREVRVVIVDPALEVILEIERAVPFVDPDEVFFDPTDDAFGIGIAFRVGPSGEDLLDAGQRAIESEVAAGWLAAVVRDQMQVMLERVFDSVWESAVDGHLQSIKPVIGLGLNAKTVADDLFGVPVEDHG